MAEPAKPSAVALAVIGLFSAAYLAICFSALFGAFQLDLLDFLAGYRGQ